MPSARDLRLDRQSPRRTETHLRHLNVEICSFVILAHCTITTIPWDKLFNLEVAEATHATVDYKVVLDVIRDFERTRSHTGSLTALQIVRQLKTSLTSSKA